MPETPGDARIVAIANQKGGVGKSTTAVSLGAALADLGYRVLVVDLDPQGNASTGMGIRHEARATTVYDVIVGDRPIAEAVVETQVARLSGVPATIDLAGAEIELVSQFSREGRLKKALESVRTGSYDFVLLDCPPSLGLLTVNALTAAEELIVPIQCEYYALEGLGQLLRNVGLVQQNINPELRLTGIVMTMFDPRTKLSEQVVDEVRRHFGELVYDVVIPRTVRLSEAPGFGQPITVYDPRSRGAETYRELAREVASRPPPEGPMPAFEDLPEVVVPQNREEATLAAEVEPEPEPEPEPELEPGSEPEGKTPEPEETPERPGEDLVAGLADEATPTSDSGRDAVTPKAEAAGPIPADLAPLALEPEAAPSTAPMERKPPAEPEPRTTREPTSRQEGPVAPARDLAEAIWEDEPSPPRVRPARPAQDHTRRVVVIDDDADLEAVARRRAQPARPPTEADAEADEGVAPIGATLEDDGAPKRRWRLFRKGDG